MNKSAQVISVCMLCVSVGVLVGCEKQETPPPTDKTSLTASNTKVSVSSLDEIKWDEVKDPLIEDEMLTKLKAAISAFVTNDLNQFHDALAPGVGTGHDYLLEQPVKFTGIDKASVEKGNRITIPVVGDRLRVEKGFSRDIRYIFYFEKNKDGKWNIVSID